MQHGYIQYSLSADAALPVRNADQFPDLPVELWLYIYDLVPHPHQRKMLWINRMLFQMVMSELHGEAGFITSDPRVLSDQLGLYQSPSLSKYVRVLTLRPASIREALGMHEKPHEKPGKLTQYLHRFHSRIDDAIRRRCPSLSVVRQRQLSTSQLEPFPSPKKRVQMFVSVLQNFTHVDKFEIIWPYDITLAGHQWEFFLFPDIWQAIGRNLTVLSIEIKVFKLGDVVNVNDCGPLPQLEELHLSLIYDTLLVHGIEGPPKSDDIEIQSLVPPSFINKFASTLQHLSIKTYGSHEFLNSIPLLVHFPRLNRLSVNMPLDVLHLRDTSHLGRFILSHPDIEDLCTRCPYLYEDTACRELDDLESVDATSNHNTDTISLPAIQIHTLELGLRLPFLDEYITPFYKNIAKLGNNITTLILQDRNMEFDQIKTVLGLFPNHHCCLHLKKLLLMARELSPELVDYLAEACPRLDVLSIHAQVLIREASKWPSSVDRNAWKDSHWILFERALIKRTTRTIKRFRTNWTLSDLSIMRYKQSMDKHVYDWKCMRTIADAVPALRSFAGRGHMVLPDLEIEESMPDVATKVKTRLDLQALQWYRPR